jgi:hypothetical protein
MHLTYFDSAGNTGLNLEDLQQPFYTMVGLICHKLKWQAVNNDFEKILDNYVPNRDRKKLEVHTVELYRSKGEWRSLGIPKCKSLIYDLLDLIPKHNLKIAYSTIKKLAYKKSCEEHKLSLEHPCEISLFFISQMVEKYLRGEGVEGLGMLIGDKEKEIEETLCDSLNYYRSSEFSNWIKSQEQEAGGKISFQSVERIIETIHFVDSHKSTFIQLTDLCAYFINRYYFKGQKPSPYLDKIKACIVDKYELI